MILSYQWLKELTEIPAGPEEFADVLTWLGMEVESVEHFKPSLDQVVIGEVKECAPIEGTDHLSITRTDIGGEVVPIVCGAPNVRVGLKTAVMLPGSVTAQGNKIKKAKLRGQESQGMLASEVELGLSPGAAGIIEGDENWIVGRNAADYLNLFDTIYDVEVTPNRPDFLSHIGVARDVAAKFRIPWQHPKREFTEIAEAASSFVKVRIDAPIACPRYAARVIRGVKIKPSPFEMGLRLTRCGCRPISNIVDVTNYLMLEYGQPLHAFDERFVANHSIVVRMAGEKEKFVSLDGQEHEMCPSDLMIADDKKAIAIAGIMGGLNSEIREDTETVIIECAYFDPIHIRRTSKRLGLGTDSAKRFERGIDPNGTNRVIDATAAMMQALGGGDVLMGRVDVYPKEIKPISVSFRPKRAVALIGIDILKEEMKDTVERLGCGIEKDSGESLQLSIPTHRPDIEREIDVIEEIIRIHGYDKIPTAISSKVALHGSDDELYAFRRLVEDVMVGMGFMQTVSLSMSIPDPRLDPPDMPEGVPVANPVTDEMKYFQGSVLPQLARAAAANFQRGDRNLRLFETTRTFHPGAADDPRTWEKHVVAGLITGQSYPQSWSHDPKPFDYYDLKGVIHTLCTRLSLDNYEIYCYDTNGQGGLKCELKVGGISCGKLGVWEREVMSKRDIDAAVGWFELDLALLKQGVRAEVQYKPLPRFPIAWRDLALLVDRGIKAGELQVTINEAGGEFLEGVRAFDLYEGKKLGENKKSLAFRLEFSHPERSLGTEEVDGWMAAIVKALEGKHGAALR
jgi:phenylalanyl-tRNA synthetase beta chain